MRASTTCPSRPAGVAEAGDQQHRRERPALWRRGDPDLTREGDTAVLAVEDAGPGIPAAELAEVLQPFHRLDSARARNTAGLGLGLTIVQQILQREGGSLV
jgi:signal transduction histidine kinase